MVVTRDDVSAETLRAFCAARLSDYKVAETIALTDEATHACTGRARMRERVQRQHVLGGVRSILGGAIDHVSIAA